MICGHPVPTHDAVRRHWQALIVYSLALILTIATFFLCQALAVSLDERALLILFMFPILVCALLGGIGPGLTATLASAICTALLILPTDSLAMVADYDVLQWSILIINGVLVSILSESLYRSRRRETAKWQQLKAIQSQLLQSNTLFQIIFEQAAVGIAMIAPNGHWLRVNQKLCDIVGYSREELELRTFQDITHPDDLQVDLDQVQRMLNREIQSYSLEKRYIRKDGGLIWINLTVALVWKMDSIPDYFISVIKDIDMRKQAEAALYASELSYRSLFENMINSVVHARIIFQGDTPVDIEYISTNPAFATVTGITESVIGHRISEVISGYCEQNPESLEIFGRVAATGVSTRWEHYLRELNRWFSFMIYSPSHGEVIIVTENITERKIAEDHLRVSEERLKLALDATNDGLWDWDLRNGQSYLTPHYYEMTGYRPDQVTPDFEFFKRTVYPDDLPDVLEMMEAHLQGKTPVSEFDYRLVTPSGAIKWIRGKGRVVERDAMGAPLRMIGTITDISKHKAVEEALRKQTRELAQRNAELERFNRATVGRELDNDCLEAASYKLSRQLGQEIPYSLTFLDAQSIQQNEKLQ